MNGLGEIRLNPEQARAVEHGGGPLMVLAGAGSGKTRVLVHRIAGLVERGVPPYRILAVTFTNKAAGEMRERLRQLLGGLAESMWIGTFHATCARLLRIHHEAAGLGRDFTIFDTDDQLRLVTALLKELGLKDEVTPKSILWAIDRAKNAGADPVEAASPYLADYLRRVYPRYTESLARENAVDFNDLLLRVLELADHPEVGRRLADRFDHILVDECQDTNRVQYELVRKLVQRTRNLTVVGDDDQSIYSWRGAEPRNLLDFDRDFPDAEVVKLEQNYRSTQVILEAANAVIAHNVDRHEKRLWSERDGGEPILWEECDDDRGEADFLARAIAGLVAEDGREWGDVAILYRTHAQSRVIEEALRAHRIDYRIVGGVSFFQRKEIKDIRAYLRLVCNPASDSCFDRVVNVPARGIGKTTVDRVREHARTAGISLMDAARAASHGEVPSIKAAARKKLAEFVDIIEGLRQVVEAGASVSELIIQAVERSGYRERLEQEGSHESKDRLANLGELVNMAGDFDDSTNGQGTLVDFEERISLASANDEEDGLGQTVTMMTIHAAKGLEFPIVFVAGMEDGLFPSMRGRDDADDRDSLEEERRLAYVAFTRARDRLILTSAKLRRQWAEVRVSQASRFVTEIPVECMAVRARPERPPAAERLRRHRRPMRPAVDEFDQRTHYDEDVFSDVPVFDAFGGDDGGVGAGALVEHASFGTGRVIESRGSGRDKKLLIHFGSVGLKTILARFVDPADGLN